MLLFQVRAVLAKKRASVHELFCEMDANGDGVLSRTELHAGLVSLGIPLVGDAFDALWKFLDTNGDGTVDWDEFNFFVHIQEVEPGVFTTGSMARITTGSKASSAASIKQTVADMSRTIQTALHSKRCTLEQLFAEIDEDGSGGIDRKEFTRAMRKLDIVMVRRSFGDMHAALR